MTTHRACAALAAAFLLTVFARTAFAHSPDDARATIADLSWIAGAWVGEYDTHRFEEHWTIPAAGCMTGMFRWTAGERPRVHELILLEQEEGGLTMRLRHFGAGMRAWEDGPLVFRLVEHASGRAEFHQREVESPKKLIYALDEAGTTLTVSLIETHDGQERATRFPMRKAKE